MYIAGLAVRLDTIVKQRPPYFGWRRDLNMLLAELDNRLGSIETGGTP